MMDKKRRSQKQEKSVAKKFNARTVVASGAKWAAKGDVRNTKYLIECKTTKESYYSVTSKVWEKIEEEAIRDHLRIPLLIVDLKDKERYVVFNAKDFDMLPEPNIGEDISDNIPKSFRIALGDIEKTEREIDKHIFGRLFIICGKKKDILFCMRYNDFKDFYEEV